MNLTSVQSASRTAGRPAPAGAGSRRAAGQLDVTISDGGVAVDGEAAEGVRADARPAAEARLLSAIATPSRAAPGSAAEAPRETAPVAAPEAPAAPARPTAATEVANTDPAPSRTLGMYTGRGRAVSMPLEGLSGQLIDVTG